MNEKKNIIEKMKEPTEKEISKIRKITKINSLSEIKIPKIPIIKKIEKLKTLSDITKSQQSNKLSKLTKALTILLSLMILIAGCSGRRSSNTTIDGRDLMLKSKEFDELNVENVVATQSEKYTKHYKNNLYYEDLSKPQQELNKLYNKYLRTKLNNYIQLNIPELVDTKYMLKTQIEYVNQDAKDYQQGKIKAEDIIDNPDSMMNIKIKLYFFEDFEKLKSTQEENIQLSEKLSREFLEKEFVAKYLQVGIENVAVIVRAYPKETLDKYSIEEIEKQKNIELFLQKEGEKSTLEGNFFSTYYSKTIKRKSDASYFETNPMFFMYPNITEKKNLLKERYNIDFDESEGFFMPTGNPNVLFEAYYYDVSATHFQEAMYQYLANKVVSEQIKKAGLSDKVVFLVETEPDLDITYDESSSKQPYNFGEGFDEKDFLKDGYTGDVNVTFIYLDKEFEKPKEEFTNEEATQYRDRIVEELKEKVIFPVFEEHLGVGRIKDNSGGKMFENFKTPYVYIYNVSDYDRKIVVDLFKKHSLTERGYRPDLGLLEVTSLTYDTRAETPGFHYLDIFGKYFTYEEISAYDIKRFIEGKK